VWCSEIGNNIILFTFSNKKKTKKSVQIKSRRVRRIKRYYFVTTTKYGFVLDDITSSDDIPMGDVILHYEGTSFYNDDFSVTFKIKQYE
jgi:hypothetical protein